MALIERLEQATEGSRELDLAISVAINFKGALNPQYEWRWGAGGDEIEGHRNGRREAVLDPVQFVPRWTESIDAALGLVPKDMEWEVSTIYGIARATVGLNAGNEGGPWHGERKDLNVALALTIAALRAHQETGNG